MFLRRLAIRAQCAAAEALDEARRVFNARQSSAKQIDATMLEDRVLFSASPVAAALVDSADPTFQSCDVNSSFDDHLHTIPSDACETHVSDDQRSEHYRWLQSEASYRGQSQSHELVLVDASVEDHEQLVADLLLHSNPDRELKVYLLDGGRDGVEQIGEILTGYEDVDAVHLVSHGGEGQVQLGNTRLSISNLGGYASEIAAWHDSLRNGADLLIYGCELAGSERGRALTEALGTLCGGDVAASVDDTGQAALGGDWDLEFAVGAIETEIAFSSPTQQSWMGLLAVEAFQEGVAGYSDTHDTFVDSDNPTTPRGTADDLTTHSGTRQALIRFDNLFDSGTGPIPVDSIIHSATLTIDVSGQLSGSVINIHQMLTSWTEGSTWNALANGVQLGSEAVGTPDDSVDGGSGTAVFDVTRSLQDWSLGTMNNGWVLANDTNNDWKGTSSEKATVGDRPQLTVDYTPADLFVTNNLDTINGNTSNVAALLSSDGGDGISLREAILATNNTPGLNTVGFKLSGSNTISVSSALPDITRQLILDGRTDSDYDGAPVIEIDGFNGGTPVVGNGLTISGALADGSVIRGVVINDFDGHGIEINGSDNVLVAYSYIGTNVAGTADEGNRQNGVLVTGGTLSATIGGTAAKAGNVISGNNLDGIRIDGGSSGTVVQGNYIGTDKDGTADLGNALIGVRLTGAVSSNLIGGSGAAAGNVIAGNDDSGIRITGSNSDSNLIQGNFVGTNYSGTGSIANTKWGIIIDNGPQSNIIGTDGDGSGDSSEGNVVSGNGWAGISVQSAGDNVIAGNYVGLDATGMASLGNLGSGIYILNSSSTRIGTDDDGVADIAERNVISSNGGSGIDINGASNSNNTIAGNYIGTNALGSGSFGNVQNGVILRGGAHDATVGGTTADLANVIANNGAAGIAAAADAGVNNAFHGNSIRNNTGLGIDLKDDDAVEPFSAGDTDNHPILTTATATADGASVNVSGSLNGLALTDYRIEFFKASGPGNGEGDVYLGFINVATSATGTVGFTVPSLSGPFGAGDYISATATELSGPSTSEFSLNAAVEFTPEIVVSSSTRTFDEGATPLIVDPTVTVNDIDSTHFSGGRVTVSITAGGTLNDELSIISEGNSPGEISADATTVYFGGAAIGLWNGGSDHTDPLTIDFTTANAIPTAVERLAERIAFHNDSDNPSEANRTVQFVLRDSDGDNSNPDTRTVAVTAVNDAPIQSVPGPQAVFVGVPGVFNATNGNLISISDVDANSGPLEITLNATNGTFTLSGVAGLSFTVGDGTTDTTMTFNGTLSAINTALDGGSFTGTAAGAGSLRIITDDQANTGSGGPQSDDDTVAITIDPLATILDQFNAVAFNGNDGTQPWQTNWQEVNDDGTTGGGNLRVLDSTQIPGSFELQIGVSSGGPSTSEIRREADLTGATLATLTFDYRRHSSLGYYSSDPLLLEISMDGGTTWDPTPLVTWTNGQDATIQNMTIDISTWISPNTTIRLRETASGGSDWVDGFIYFDNIQIEHDGMVPNSAPVADATVGAPYAIFEGDSVTFDGSNSFDPDPGETPLLTYQWDVGNDGSFEKSGITANYTWADLVSAGVNDHRTVDVALRVTDPGGLLDTVVFTLDVSNTAPTLSVTGGASVNEDTLYSLMLAGSDPGNDAITEWTVDWGDGTLATYNFASGTANHTYSTGGTYNILIAATDEDGTYFDRDLLVPDWESGGDDIYRFDASNGSFDSTLGNSAGELRAPYEAIVGPNGDIYVSGFESDNVVRYDASGNHLGEFVASRLGGLDGASGLAFDTYGNLYVASFFGAEVLRYDSSGNFVDVFGAGGSGMNGPSGVAFGPDGDLYVTSWGNGKVYKYDGLTGGSPSAVINSGLSQPEQLVFDENGDLFIADAANNQIKKYDGSLTTFATGSSYTPGLTFSPEGILYASSYGTAEIVMFDATTGASLGTLVTSGSNGLSEPYYITLIPDHQVRVWHINDAPINTVPGTQTVVEASQTAIAGISVSDTDARLGLLTTRLQVTGGVLDVTLSGGATISAGANGSSDLTIQGDLADLNATLASLQYTGNPGVTGINADTITVTTDDQGNTGIPGPLQDIDTIQIDVTAVNDAPVNMVPGTQTVNEATQTAIAGISVSDTDAGPGLLTTRLQVTGGVLDVTLSGGATISAGANGSGDLTIQGNLAGLNATLASLQYTGNPGVTGINADTITVTTDDQGNTGIPGPLQDIDTIQINITAVNDAPVNAVLGTQTVNETTQTAIAGVSVSDTDAGAGLLTTRLQVASGVLDVTLSGGATISAGANGSGDLTIQGNLAGLNATIASLQYTGNPGVTGINADTITVTTDDQGNTGIPGPLQDVDTIQINITAVNDAPVNTVPGTQTINETTQTAIAGISVSDTDAGAGLLTTRLQVASGVLDVTLSGGATISAGANGSSDLTIQGNLADLNATLASLQYTGNVGVTGVNADTITVTTDDQGNTGIPGPLQDIDTIQVDIGAVNNAPVNTAPGTQTVSEATPTTISGISVSDTDAGAGLLTTRLQVTSGVLDVTLSGGATISAGANGSGDLTIRGNLADLNATLASLQYTGNVGVTGVNADTITVRTDDQGNTGIPGPLQDVDTIQIDITAVNDAPVNTVPAIQTVSEATPTTISGISVSDTDAGAGMLTTRLQVTSGLLDVTLSGGATISAGANGSGDLTIRGNLADLNATLASMQYTGNVGVTGVNADTITVTTDDQGNTGIPGPRQDIDTIQVDIGAVNNAPVNTVPGTQAVSEAAPTTIAGISVSDADAGAGLLTTRLQVTSGVLDVTLSGGATISAGANGSGDLTIRGNLADLNATLASVQYTGNVGVTGVNADTITVTTDDQGNTGIPGPLQDVDTIQINITAVNDAPVNTVPAIQAVSEATPTTIAGISVSDTDAGAGMLTTRLQVSSGLLDVTLSGGATISAGANGSGDLTIRGNLADLNAALASVQYTGNVGVTGVNADTITVTTDDQGNTGIPGPLQDIDTIQVDVSGANDPQPVASSDAFMIPGNATYSVVSPGVLANDGDVDSGALSSQLVTGPSNGSLALNPDGSFTYTPSASFVGTDSFTYVVNDGERTSLPATVTITVAPLPPTFFDPASTEPPLEDHAVDEPAVDEPTVDEASDPQPTSSGRPTKSQASERPKSTVRTGGDEVPVIVVSPTPKVLAEVTGKNVLLNETRETERRVQAEIRLKGRSLTSHDIRFATEDGFLWHDLDTLADRVDEEIRIPDLMVGGTAGVTSVLTVGYVVWLIKGGHILAGVLAQMPAWKLIDPLPILAELDDEEEEEGNLADDSLQSLIDKGHDLPSNKINHSREEDDEVHSR